MIAALSGCVLSHAPEVAARLPTQDTDAWSRLAEPGPIVLATHISARWTAPVAGLVDLRDPKAAAIRKGELPIVLPVHVLRHPERGTFVVDTGVDRDLAAGGHGPARGLVRGVVRSIEPVAPLGDLLGGEAPAAVLLTHMHLDHVLGLPDVPDGTPVYTGAGEQRDRKFVHQFVGGTYRRVLDGITLHVLDPATAVPLGEAGVGWDLVGDGSLWAIASPGHTPGSLAYLARTTEGPVLFVGDTSHTRWGWDHGIPPGTFTSDPEANRESLARLRALVAAHPEIRVEVGHEPYGVDGLAR